MRWLTDVSDVIRDGDAMGRDEMRLNPMRRSHAVRCDTAQTRRDNMRRDKRRDYKWYRDVKRIRVFRPLTTPPLPPPSPPQPHHQNPRLPGPERGTLRKWTLSLFCQCMCGLAWRPPMPCSAYMWRDDYIDDTGSSRGAETYKATTLLYAPVIDLRHI